MSIRPFARDLWSKDPIHGNSLKKLLNHLSIMKVWYNKYDVIEVEEFNSFISKEFKLCSLQFCNRCIFPIDNRKKEVSTKLWYSTIGHLATRWLSPFLGVARLCAYAHMIFIALSKRDTVSYDAMFLLTKVMYSIRCLVVTSGLIWFGHSWYPTKYGFVIALIPAQIGQSLMPAMIWNQ